MSTVQRFLSQPHVRWSLLLVMATWLTHGISLRGDFVWDDVLFVDYWLPRFESLVSIFVPPDDIEYWPKSYYRPLGVLSLKVDQMLYGNDPLGWHLTNLILHSVICIQLYFLLGLIAQGIHASERLVQMASLMFAVHPIHVESVNWIAGRSDPLATLFCVAAAHASIQFGKQPRWFWLPCISLSIFAGLLCKELALAAVPLSLLTLLLLRHHGQPIIKEVKPWSQLAAAMLLPVVAYIVLRLSVSASTGNTSHALSIEGIEKVIRSLGYYFLQFFLIKPQVIGPPARFAPPLLPSLLLIIVPCILLLRGVWRRKGKLSILEWGTCGFLITIAPSLLVPAFQLDATFLYERYLYLPSFSLCVVISALAVKYIATLRVGPAFNITLVVIAVVGIAKANIYGNYWRDNLSVWENNLRHAPEDFRAHTMMGLEYRRRGLMHQSLVAYQQALETFVLWSGEEEQAYGLLINVAIAAREAGNLTLAETTAKQAVEIKSETHEGWLELGLAKLGLGDRSTAESCFLKALEIRPDSAVAFVNLSYLKPDGSQEQEALLTKAISLDPRNAMAFNNLGILYAQRRELAQATQCFEKALELNPKLQMARKNLEVIRNDESHE